MSNRRVINDIVYDMGLLSCQGEQSYMFFAHLICQMTYVEDKKMQTLGVSVVKGKITLFYNSDYILSKTRLQRVALLEHEIFHVVMNHAERKQNRNHGKFNIAGDLAINQHIKNIPDDGCHVGKGEFKHLSLNETAEQYYDKLPASMESKGCGTPLDILTEEGAELLKKAILNADLRGKAPSALSKEIDKLSATKKISWRNILKEQCSAVVKSHTEYSWKRPNRRFGGL